MQVAPQGVGAEVVEARTPNGLILGGVGASLLDESQQLVANECTVRRPRPREKPPIARLYPTALDRLHLDEGDGSAVDVDEARQQMKGRLRGPGGLLAPLGLLLTPVDSDDGAGSSLIHPADDHASAGVGEGDQRLLQLARLRQQFLEIHSGRLSAAEALPELIGGVTQCVVDQPDHSRLFRTAKGTSWAFTLYHRYRGRVDQRPQSHAVRAATPRTTLGLCSPGYATGPGPDGRPNPPGPPIPRTAEGGGRWSLDLRARRRHGRGGARPEQGVAGPVEADARAHEGGARLLQGRTSRRLRCIKANRRCRIDAMIPAVGHEAHGACSEAAPELFDDHARGPYRLRRALLAKKAAEPESHALALYGTRFRMNTDGPSGDRTQDLRFKSTPEWSRGVSRRLGESLRQRIIAARERDRSWPVSARLVVTPLSPRRGNECAGAGARDARPGPPRAAGARPRSGARPRGGRDGGGRV